MGLIYGYKAFNLDHTNMHGKYFEEGKSYHINPPIQFYKNGFHLCEHLFHVYSFYHPVEEVSVAEVVGWGKQHHIDYDSYRDIYDLYAVEGITIKRFLERQEIFNKFMNDMIFNQKLFLVYAHLSEEEMKMFIDKFHNDYNLMQCLMYNQLGIKDIYEKDYEEVKKLIRKCVNNG